MLNIIYTHYKLYTVVCTMYTYIVYIVRKCTCIENPPIIQCIHISIYTMS